MMKKYILAVLLIFLFATPVFAQFSDTSGVPWAEDAIDRLADQGIIQGMGNGKYEPNQAVTRGQFACIIVRALNPKKGFGADFPDVKSTDYYYDAIQTARANGIIMGREDGKFYPDEKVSRQDMFVMTSRAIGSTYSGVLNFNDNDKISNYAVDAIKNLLPYIKGDEKNNIRPKDTASRAETAVFVDRILNEQMKNEPTRVPSAKTPVPTTFIRGEAPIPAVHAKDWARSRGATQKFINAADNYWKYGAQMGIRADILYAQAAKETNYGKYTGMVTENMNNFAGIKTANATGDTREDHETFATLDDGVRAHFNHIAAYVGIKPVGTVHARYNKIITAEWAGKIVYTEELGGRWAPDVDYGASIVNDFLKNMHAFKFMPMNKNNKVVYLSPSKQFANMYAFGMTSEGEQMYLLAPMIKAELESMGFKVYISDKSLTFQECGDEAYAKGAFAYVALHTNASATGTIVGTECWYRGGDVQSQALSGHIYNQVAPISPGNPDGGLKDGMPRTLAEVRIPMMANCLLEIDYHDVMPIAEWIIDNKPAIAKKVAQGIANYWNTL